MKTCLWIWLYNPQEPVIYVAGRPHVLRLVDRPLENVEYVSFSSNFSPPRIG